MENINVIKALSQSKIWNLCCSQHFQSQLHKANLIRDCCISLPAVNQQGSHFVNNAQDSYGQENSETTVFKDSQEKSGNLFKA